MMSTSGQERQVLDSMQSEFARSDPRLTSMLVMFSRLTADERMPAREPIRSVVGARPVWRFRVGRRARGWLFLAAAAALVAVMMIVTHGNQVSACVHALTAACGQPHARLAGSATGIGR